MDLVQLAAPRMAAGAGLDLRHGAPAVLARPDARLGVAAGTERAAVGERERDAGIAAGAVAVRPGQVRRRRAMTGFAGYVDFLPARIEAVRGRVVVLAQAGRMAGSAAAVPVLEGAGPVNQVVVANQFALIGRIQVDPALSAFGPWAAVPDDIQGLVAAGRERHEVLLERIKPESVGDLEGLQLAVRAIGLDPVTVVATKEPAGDLAVFEGLTAEIAEHRLFGGGQHGLVMVGFAPGLPGFLVAGPARLAARVV